MRLEPDLPVAVVVGLALVADAPDRQGGGDRLEGGGGAMRIIVDLNPERDASWTAS